MGNATQRMKKSGVLNAVRLQRNDMTKTDAIACMHYTIDMTVEAWSNCLTKGHKIICNIRTTAKIFTDKGDISSLSATLVLQPWCVCDHIIEAFVNGNENNEEKTSKLQNTLEKWNLSLPKTHHLFYHYADNDISKLILRDGLLVSDIGMAGRGVYVSGYSPVDGPPIFQYKW